MKENFTNLLEEIPEIEEKLQESFQKSLGHLKDPRVERTKKHLLIDILAIALLAVISGAEGWGDIETYGKAKEDWLKNFLSLKNGIPSHDTFSRVLAALSPQEFQKSFSIWIENITRQLGVKVIGIDGKSFKQSYNRNRQQKALVLVSAWCQEHHLVLGQEKVDSKSNEITAIPKLLEQLDITGCVVTLDAMGTQKEIAAQICRKKGDYILALKANQAGLHQETIDCFKKAENGQLGSTQCSQFQTLEKNHSRIEKRKIQTLPASVLSAHRRSQWEKIKTIIRVERERSLWNKSTHEVVYYLSSLEVNAQTFGEKIRSHWGIENTLHWTLDVTFREDLSRIRRDNAPENFAILRRFALNLINQEKSFKGSVRQKRFQAGLNNDYLLKILSCL
jgi:predicted transposase YbfD/YdcC